MSKLHRHLPLLLLCALGPFATAQAADGIIHFQGAIVEAASCAPKGQVRTALAPIECDAERARAAHLPADRFRLSVKHVRSMPGPSRRTKTKKGTR